MQVWLYSGKYGMTQRCTLQGRDRALPLWKRPGVVLPCLVAMTLSSVAPVAAQFPRNKAQVQAKQQANQQAKQQARQQAKQQAKQAIVGQKQLQQNLAAGATLERFLQMTPQNRERALAKLPPARQQAILQRLGALSVLSPEEQQQLRGRYQAFLDLAQDRRQAVRGELKDLRQMPRKERQARLNSEDLKQKFSESEIELMQGSMQ
jgi:hypothetical protein